MDNLKKAYNFVIAVSVLLAAGGTIFMYVEMFGEHKEDREETRRCLIKMGREETDINKFYFSKTGLEIRHTNNKAGHYWFHEKSIKEVYWDNNVNDFYLDEDNHRTYLTQFK